MLASGAYFLRSALDGLRRAPLLHLVSITAISLALLLGGMARLASDALDSLLVASRSQAELTVYLEPNLGEERAAGIARQLTELGTRARVVSPEAALRRLRLELGDLGKLLDDLPQNPLPPTIELELPGSSRGSVQIHELSARVKGLPGVAEVDDGGHAVAQLVRIGRALRFGAAAVFTVASLAAVLIVAATLQLTIYARRQEIEVQKLVGATNQFVRTPFVIEGLFQGLVGAMAASLGLASIARLLGPKLAPLFSFVGDRVAAQPLPSGRVIVELVVAGCFLGVVGSLAAVHRFLRT